jgi:hypothetical protein
MLAVTEKPLPEDAQAVLNDLHTEVVGEPDYPSRVLKAGALWREKTNTAPRRSAFRTIRATLESMCVGVRRCAYCEDSLADEVEHNYPKNLFPDLTFQWSNYLFACGPCNAPKSNKYGVLRGAIVEEVVRRRNAPIVPPPEGTAGLINPRVEEPLAYLELDLGGVAADGTELRPTFELLPAANLQPDSAARARYTISTLGLNRAFLLAARQNAFIGYRARLREFGDAIAAGSEQAELKALWADLLRTPHLTVFVEMRRQRAWLPEINNLFDAAPEAFEWPLTAAA